MNNQFENFNNSFASSALDQLSILDNYQKPTDDIGVRPITSDLIKGKPNIIVKKRKNGKVIVYSKNDILRMQINKNFKVTMNNITKEEHKANKKISKHIKEIVKNVNGGVLSTLREFSKKTEKNISIAANRLSKNLNKMVNNLTETQKENIKKLSIKLKLLTPKTK